MEKKFVRFEFEDRYVCKEVKSAEMMNKGIKVVMVHTKVANKKARAFYEKAGFTLRMPIVPGAEDCFYQVEF